jgi:hypothetical protein
MHYRCKNLIFINGFLLLTVNILFIIVFGIKIEPLPSELEVGEGKS